MISETTLYELDRLPSLDMGTIKGSFDELPPDDYVERRLRSRRYSCYIYQDGALQRLSQKNFMQTREINKALGQVEREYQDIDSALETDPAYLKIFDEFVAHTGLTEDSLIEVHQIRWHCRGHIKEPAPEGTHQDGFDFIGMFMIDTHNVDGGEIIIYEDPDDAPCFKKHLDNGEFVILNDKKLFHNAAPLVPTANKEDGHWDVIVLTANKSRT
jgi:hypothetical protein